MSSFPATILPPKPIISIFSSTDLRGQIGLGTPASATWPTANKAFFEPINLDITITVQKLFIVNGGTVSGNFDVGIYSVDGTRIVSLGSTAQSGTTNLQPVALASPISIGPGQYYMAAVFDNTTATVFRSATTSFLPAMGVYIQTSAFPLPATATFASASAETILPLFGLSTVTNI